MEITIDLLQFEFVPGSIARRNGIWSNKQQEGATHHPSFGAKRSLRLRENYMLPADFLTLPQQLHLPTMSAMGSRKRQNAEPHSGPAKKIKILQDDDESQSDGDGEETLNINSEYAKRFEHNKKRADLHRRTF